MKTTLFAVMLGAAVLAAAQDAAKPSAPQTSAPATSAPATATASAPATQGQSAATSQGPMMKDPAEYNAYLSAIGQKDPAKQLSALEAFLQKYPNSVMKPQALDVLLGLYQQTKNPKVTEVAQSLLALNPDNAKARLVLAFNERTAMDWADAKKDAELGLDSLPKWTKPDGLSDADFAKQKTAFNNVLESIAGFSALQLKDYPSAQKHLRAAVEADPSNLENIYPLALASLPPSSPADEVNGLFFIARAINLVNDAGVKRDWGEFGHRRYVRYHGGEGGWNDLLKEAATTPLPPAGFTIHPAPTPAEQAHGILAATAPDKMDFAQWEFVLSNGAQADQDLVWNAIKGKPQPLNGTVIKATSTEFDIAASLDDIESKTADLTLTFEAPVPKSMIPNAGASLDFVGEPASYTGNPFMLTMEKGKLSRPRTAPKPAPKPAAGKKPAAASK